MGDCLKFTKDCAGKILHGATGLAKAAMGLDKAPMQIVLHRRDICRECPHATRNGDRLNRTTKGLTSLSRCTKCDCIIKAKTMLASEACPIGYWPTVE